MRYKVKKVNEIKLKSYLDKKDERVGKGERRRIRTK